MSRALTTEETAAIAALKRLAKRWPKTLKLFSWSGSLVIMEADMEAGQDAVLGVIGSDIPNDGGDP